MDVTVVVATFGDDAWREMGMRTAEQAFERDEVNVIVEHGHSLHEARNTALHSVRSEWVCFLDADDEFEHGYIRKMAEATSDVRVPSVRYVRNGFDQGVRMPKVAGHDHACTPDCLAWGNWIVIGAVARTALLLEVGGFRDFPWSEDWDLWVRCWQAGATIEPVPRAVYRAHVRTDSRNRGLSARERRTAHNLIAEANGLPLVSA